MLLFRSNIYPLHDSQRIDSHSTKTTSDEEAKMPESSLEHDFIVKDIQEAERLIAALTTPNTEGIEPPVKTISGRESVTLLMTKWSKNNKDHR